MSLDFEGDFLAEMERDLEGRVGFLDGLTAAFFSLEFPLPLAVAITFCFSLPLTPVAGATIPPVDLSLGTEDFCLV